MKDILVITDLNQLKAVSDPFRVQLLYHLGKFPQTGQMLSEKINISRSKIHYHLQELEKNGIIEVVRREEKNGILQKFYLPVAKAIIPSEDLLAFDAKANSEIERKSYNFSGTEESLDLFIKKIDEAYKELHQELEAKNLNQYEVTVQWVNRSLIDKE